MSIQARIERAKQQGRQEARGGPEEITGASDSFKERLLAAVIAELDREGGPRQGPDLERQVEAIFDRLMADQANVLGRRERQLLLESLTDEIMGYGPVQSFLNDATIDEIMVNGPDRIYIEREGKIEKTKARFESDEHVMRIIERIVAPLGRRIDESQPYVDARLPDGSRVNVIIPPLALNGPTVTIRKFARTPFTTQQLIDRGTFTAEFIQFIKACVEGKLNVVISGGTGTGKTTLLNIISAYIPDDERIITIEDAAELQLRQEHVISLESRPKNIEGKGEVTRGDLVVNALRMRPDRIIVGECRSGEAIDMLQAMNTGHEGSMTTVHANSPRDALHRLETMVMMAGYDLPLRAIREQIASALDVMVHLERMRDGARRIVSVVEIQGMEGEVITTQEIFKFQMTGQQEGRILGRLAPTGTRPKFMEKVEAAGFRLPPTVFGLDPRIYRS